jgi:hypothetical protein
VRALATGLAVAGLIWSGHGPPAAVAAKGPADPAVKVEAEPGGIDAVALTRLERYAQEAATAVRQCLGSSRARSIRIVLDSQVRAPFAGDVDAEGRAEIRLPAGRFVKDDVAASKFALHHELTHVIAPGREGDRLLIEGLGVHMQDLLGNASYPDFEASPGEVVRSLEAGGILIPLADSERARRERPTGEERRLAYAQEGAFVRWLIGRHGLDRFMKVYEGQATFQSAYGADLAALERAWRASPDGATVAPAHPYCRSR